MTTEIKLKQYILSRYKSVREFCMQNDFPYSTVDSIFKRGLLGSSLSIVMKVCDRLNIDVDELTNGNIVEKSPIIIELTEQEKRLISAYRDKPEMRTAVDKLLGIDEVEQPAKKIIEMNTPSPTRYGMGVAASGARKVVEYDADKERRIAEAFEKALEHQYDNDDDD